MERVAFLLEPLGHRIPCLLNPESLEIRRLAGLQPCRSITGEIKGIADDTLLYTGGGQTELDLKLLFDTSVAGASVVTEDVRDLTGPLWQLAENLVKPDQSLQPPIVRFIWGKSWNIPGVVAAVAERLEDFTRTGIPRRSWMRMRFLRVLPSKAERQPVSSVDQVQAILAIESPGSLKLDVPDEQIQQYEVTYNSRPDTITSDLGLPPWLWKALMIFNHVEDPLHLPPGQILRVPPLPYLLQIHARSLGAMS